MLALKPQTSTNISKPQICDKFGRSFTSLRISLTSACNLGCNYCVPNDYKLQRMPDELTPEQFIEAIDLLDAVLDLQEIRITGGEPLLARSFDHVLLALWQFQGKDISLTTNALLVPAKLEAIKASPINRLNISLDSLEPFVYQQICRGDKLQVVLEAIELLLAAGYPLKINMVPMRRLNFEDILPMLEFCLERGIELRYIELMQMGHLFANQQDFAADFIGLEEILGLISKKFVVRRLLRPAHSTSEKFAIAGFKTGFGVISNYSAPFCGDCNRLRLSSNGRLFGCISNSKNEDIRDILQLPSQERQQAILPLLEASLAHKQAVRFRGEDTVMKYIGG